MMKSTAIESVVKHIESRGYDKIQFSRKIEICDIVKISSSYNFNIDDIRVCFYEKTITIGNTITAIASDEMHLFDPLKLIIEKWINIEQKKIIIRSLLGKDKIIKNLVNFFLETSYDNETMSCNGITITKNSDILIIDNVEFNVESNIIDSVYHSLYNHHLDNLEYRVPELHEFYRGMAYQVFIDGEWKDNTYKAASNSKETVKNWIDNNQLRVFK